MEKSYLEILNKIKQTISVSRIKANLTVNNEMVCLYLKIGKTILQQQKENS